MARQWIIAMIVAVAMAVPVKGAHADSIPLGTYDVSGLSANGYNLSGTLTLNASGVVTAGDITLQDAALEDPVFSQITSAGGPAGYAPVANYVYLTDPGVGQISLEYLTSLDGSGSVSVCTLSANDCNGYQASYLQIYEASSFGYGLVKLSGDGVLDAAVASSPGTDTNAGTGSQGSNSPSAGSAATPEPTSLALLGTGILGVATLTRKRKRRV